MSSVIFFFLRRGKNICSGNAFTIPGSGFDTTSFRNRNHNKLGAHLFARRGTPWFGKKKFLLCLVDGLSASAGRCLPRCWKGMKFLAWTAETAVEHNHNVSGPRPSPTPTASSHAFPELLCGHRTLRHGHPFARTMWRQGCFYTASLGFRWQHKTSLVTNRQVLGTRASTFVRGADTLRDVSPKGALPPFATAPWGVSLKSTLQSLFL